MSMVTIFPEAYIDQERVRFSFGRGVYDHLIYARVPVYRPDGGFRMHEACATNPDRALQDLREQIAAQEFQDRMQALS